MNQKFQVTVSYRDKTIIVSAKNKEEAKKKAYKRLDGKGKVVKSENNRLLNPLTK